MVFIVTSLHTESRVLTSPSSDLATRSFGCPMPTQTYVEALS
jgi:hypothetical protein